MLKKYADLLVNYCLSINPREKLYVRSTTLAEPLIKEVYRAAIKAGAHVDIEMDFEEKAKIFNAEANEDQLRHIPLLYKEAMTNYDAYLYIRAPFNLKENSKNDAEKAKIRSTALKPIQSLYFERTATLNMKRSLCQYPTRANAQEAGMSLEDYTAFIFNACKLNDNDPKASWLAVRKEQQKMVNALNKATIIRYKTVGTDITFNTEGRQWMNSDGQTNMPSGEVYTSPVEDAVNGYITFSYPGLYMGHEVKNVRLEVKDGYITKWSADQGMDFLNHIFSLEGTRRFGEAAIGTNYGIQKITKNILFDEKIGGSVHMAIGQSYLQCGGKNESTVHWDMITDMTKEGQIYADGKLIYEKGVFLF